MKLLWTVLLLAMAGLCMTLCVFAPILLLGSWLMRCSSVRLALASGEEDPKEERCDAADGAGGADDAAAELGAESRCCRREVTV